MITVYLVKYKDEEGNHVWWHETLNKYACEAVVEILQEDLRNPEVISFDVSCPETLVGLSDHPEAQRHKTA